jgi:cell wall-associated NlpC family hydrolase
MKCLYSTQVVLETCFICQQSMDRSFHTFRRIRALLFMMGVAIIALFSSCSTDSGQKTTEPIRFTAPKADRHAGIHTIEKLVREEYERWKGTRHRLGGTGRQGIDCSGFVRVVYKSLFDIVLPRTSRSQSRIGRPVGRGELRAGDLVFFKPPTYPNHVGIYLSENEFVHVSKKEGVTISVIGRHYWGRYYWTARRVLF